MAYIMPTGYNQIIMLTKYHYQILSEALSESLSPRALSAIAAANNYQDRLSGQFGHDEYHVDNNSFQQSNDYIEEQRGITISSLNANDAKAAWAAFGRLTHTAHDFYAHSNYIDLWLALFNGNQPPAPHAPHEIDPVHPALLNHPDLHSGKVYYPLELFYYVRPLRRFVLSRIPRDSHAWMNLDSPEQGFKFDYAMQAAIKRTKIEFDKTTLGFSEEMCRLFLDK
jgi:hypothetical protein